MSLWVPFCYGRCEVPSKVGPLTADRPRKVGPPELQAAATAHGHSQRLQRRRLPSSWGGVAVFLDVHSWHFLLSVAFLELTPGFLGVVFGFSQQGCKVSRRIHGARPSGGWLKALFIVLAKGKEVKWSQTFGVPHGAASPNPPALPPARLPVWRGPSPGASAA